MKTHTVKNLLNHMAKWRPDHTALIERGFKDSKISYQECNTQARKFANSLKTFGLEKGDRVAFLAESSLEQIIAYFSLSKIGAIGVPLHRRESYQDIISYLKYIDADILITDSQFDEKIQLFKEKEWAPGYYIMNDRSGSIPDYAYTYTDVISDGSEEQTGVCVDPSDTAYINLTSGSTGTPKGIVHTHKEVIEAAHLMQHMAGLYSKDVFLNPKSLSFIGWANWQFPMINVGGTSVLLPKWNPEAVPRLIELENVSVICLTPTQWKMVLNTDIETYDLSSLRLAAYAGETINETLLTEINEKICDDIACVYGSTEVMTSGTILHPWEMSRDNIDSIGKPATNVDLRIIKPESRNPEETVRNGDTGELIIRGPSVAEKIWEKPEQTANTFHKDGWWYSGDLGYVNESGHICLEGRKDNMIISGGLNIYGENIEQTLESHNKIVEAAVIGVPDDRWGETIRAYIVTNSDSLTAAKLDQWCKENDELASYKRPRDYRFCGRLPRTSSGKIDRTELN